MHSAYANTRIVRGRGPPFRRKSRAGVGVEAHSALADLDATWHMIGHLQSNKAARAVRLFTSIDRWTASLWRSGWTGRRRNSPQRSRRAQRRAETRKRRGRWRDGLPVLIEVKLDPEAAKSGVEQRRVAAPCGSGVALPHLELRGLMGVPPYFDDRRRRGPISGVCANCATRYARKSEGNSCPRFPWGCRTISKSPSKKARRKFASAPRYSARDERPNPLADH